MTTQDLIQELQRDDQNRKVVVTCVMQGNNPTYEPIKIGFKNEPIKIGFKIDRIVMLPQPTIILIEK